MPSLDNSSIALRVKIMEKSGKDFGPQKLAAHSLPVGQINYVWN